MAIFRVTASRLNLRQSADKAAAVLAVIPQGAIVQGAVDASPTSGWTRIAANGQTGYAASQFLEDLGRNSAPPVAASPPVNVDRRDANPARLHPVVREKVAALLVELNAKQCPFRIFEAYRAPERQRHLHAQGRTRPGLKITNAEAWESYHQYGLAADIVLFINGQWSWSSAGPLAKMWDELQAQARLVGLETLSFERPHVQLMGVRLGELKAGRLPDGGDDSWYEAVTEAAARWRQANGAPAAPPIERAERPPLDNQS